MSRDTLWQGKHLQVVREHGWEYAERVGGLNAVVILARGDDHLLLIEQHRVPAGGLVLELPAGLVGDDGTPESPGEAAARELEEETGYRAERIEEIGFFLSSPGLTSEGFTLVRANGLTRVGEPEDGITVYRVKRADVPAFVAQRRAVGVAVDAKLLLFVGAEDSPASAGGA